MKKLGNEIDRARKFLTQARRFRYMLIRLKCFLVVLQNVSSIICNVSISCGILLDFCYFSGKLLETMLTKLHDKITRMKLLEKKGNGYQTNRFIHNHCRVVFFTSLHCCHTHVPIIFQKSSHHIIKNLFLE